MFLENFQHNFNSVFLNHFIIGELYTRNKCQHITKRSLKSSIPIQKEKIIMMFKSKYKASIKVV